MTQPFRAVGTAFLLALLPALAAAQSGYHVTKRMNTAGDGGWDYLAVDTAGHRLYVSRGTHVQVVDLDRDSLVGDIPNTPGVHGIAFAPALGRGFTSNGRDTSVTIFDLKTLAPVSVVKVTGLNPDAILFDAFSGRVFTFNHTGASVTAIDAATGAVAGTVPLDGTAETGQSDGKGTIFVNIENKNVIDVFDATTLRGEAAHRAAGLRRADRYGHRPREGAAVGGLRRQQDHGDRRLSRENGACDGAGGRRGRRQRLRSHDGTRLRLGGRWHVAVVREDTPNHFMVELVPTARGARTMALDARTHRIYLSSAQYGPMPAATADRPRPRAPLIPGSFTVLELDR